MQAGKLFLSQEVQVSRRAEAERSGWGHSNKPDSAVMHRWAQEHGML